MATIQQLKDRVADFSNRTGLFSIQKIEFFLLFKDLIDKLKEAFDNINASSKQLTWQDPVVEFADLATTYPVPEKGWAVTVLSEGFVYSYNGSSWKNTGITALPDDMATADTVEEAITARQELARSQSVSKSPVSKVLDDFANAVENTISGLQAGKIDKTAVKQVAGSSTTDLMSQKAVSDMFEHLATNLNQAVANLTASINSEATARQNGDTNEAAERAQAIATAVANLTAAINDEATARQDGDANEATARSQAIAAAVDSILSDAKSYTDTKTGGLIRGVTINGQYLSGAKRVIEEGETLLVPEGFEYIASSLTVKDTVNIMGTISII